MSFRLDSRLPDALRARGIQVVELPSWESKGSAFASVPVGQAAHWDAIGKGIDPGRWSNMLQRFPKFNYSPTYNGGIYDDGVVYLWASGKTVNVGKVDSSKIARLRASEDVGTGPSSGDIWGNSVMLGWVVRNSGAKSDPITVAQKRSLIVLCATVCELYGIEVSATVHHRELTRRKIDIAANRLNMDLRASIEKYHEGAAALITEPGETMPEVAALDAWEIERRAIHRMEQMYRYAWGVESVPDNAGYRFWCDRIKEAAPKGATVVGETVLAAIEAGLKVRKL